ncbi:uncharacterized protein T551_01977 [Pneumocystis jirovecii RU7]|uniref:EamA domain-containing protein n=1 Tax=Pneumocystis jirovecii (strain RU7) TaxID=1408657 RepID=A0A0W4ZNU6_PNEJ7|nr:uncharacterized protein T551_01977 [Pneumocystis jirovecii RU7]KTW30033.1 hypothetical protein T551_01977 [Pneumocystis jirovecii RU7]
MQKMAINHGNNTIETNSNKIRLFFNKYYGITVLILSQPLYSTMNVCVKILSQNPIRPWSTFQIILFRMVPTYVLGIIYYRYSKTSSRCYTDLKTKIFLLLRSLFGFIGLCGVYYSIHHLNLSDVTALLFLNPIFINLLAHPILYKTFNFFDIYPALISFSGVLCVTKPDFILNSRFSHKLTNKDSSSDTTMSSTNSNVIPVLTSLVGVLGTCLSYIIIKGLGNHIDALESVLWFSLISSIGAFLVIFFLKLPFYLPLDYSQVFALSIIGISGFLAQVLLTKGLQIEKIGRASATVYLQIIFSLIYDKLIWGNIPDVWSFCGIVLIITGTTIAIIGKDRKKTEIPDQENQYTYPSNMDPDN